MPGLQVLVTIFGISIAVLIVFSRLRIPPIIGFFMTGILAGPDGFRLIADVHQVEPIAEIGVILLLFTIGIEFSMGDLVRIRKTVLLGGSLQVGITLALVFVIAWAFGQTWQTAFFLGCIVSLCSTAVVLRVLQTRAETEAPHGRASLGIAIYQDLITVPMMLLIPMLGGDSEGIVRELTIMVGKGILIVGLVLISARYVVPKIFFLVAKSRSRELFIFAVLFFCFAIAWGAEFAGLSLALGAFIAGLIVSESEYSQQALGDVVPFKDVFASLFFISIGMLLDLDMIAESPVLVIAGAAGVLLVKAAIAGFAVRMLGFSLRISIVTGIAISQIGEFSFILAEVGIEQQLLSDELYQLFLAVSILTMAVTPFLIAGAPKFAAAVCGLPLPEWLKREARVSHHEAREKMHGHLIIIGYGLNGSNLARAAKLGGIPYVIIETNPETVRRERARGEKIFYGDATHVEVLEAAGIEDAKVAVIAISDAAATRQIAALARRLNGGIHIIARTRFMQETKPLIELGADEVVPEEFETSVEIFTRVLKRYLVPNDEIDRFIQEIRSDSYAMLRRPPAGTFTLPDLRLHLPDVELVTYRVAEGAPVTKQSIAELNLRKVHGVLVLAIGRGGEMIVSPPATERMQAEDLVVLFGQLDRLNEAAPLFRDSAQVQTS